MVGLFSFYVNLGSIIGSLVDNYTSRHLNKLSYQIPLACMFIVPVLLTTALFAIPESPRWLLHHDKHDEARKSLERLRFDQGDQLELEARGEKGRPARRRRGRADGAAGHGAGEGLKAVGVGQGLASRSHCVVMVVVVVVAVTKMV